MQIFKFGGASVKDADGVRNLARIVNDFSKTPLIVVVSAMGKTTNALEKVAEAYFYKTADPKPLLEEVKNYHLQIINQLFEDKENYIFRDIEECFAALDWDLEDLPIKGYDFHYDQIVSLGEMVSTKIVAAWLNKAKPTEWLEARDYVKTDDTWREGRIDWKETQKAIDELLLPKIKANTNFIGVFYEKFKDKNKY